MKILRNNLVGEISLFLFNKLEDLKANFTQDKLLTLYSASLILFLSAEFLWSISEELTVNESGKSLCQMGINEHADVHVDGNLDWTREQKEAFLNIFDKL